MKVRIDRDECHPYFITEGTIGKEVELTKKGIARIKRVEDEYWAVQEFLEKKFNGG